MKTTTKIKLLTDAEGKKVLLRTMEAFNDACNDIAETCFVEHSASKFSIQKLVYQNIRQKYGLSAQLTIRAIAKTCEAYKLNKKVQPKFKKRGCITYDPRNAAVNIAVRGASIIPLSSVKPLLKVA